MGEGGAKGSRVEKVAGIFALRRPSSDRSTCRAAAAGPSAALGPDSGSRQFPSVSTLLGRKFQKARPFHTLRGRPTSVPDAGVTTRLVSRCEMKNERHGCASWRDGFAQHRRRPTVTSCSNARGCGSSKSRDTPSWTRPRRIQRSPGRRLTPLLENVRCGSGGTGPRSGGGLAWTRSADHPRLPSVSRVASSTSRACSEDNSARSTSPFAQRAFAVQ
jgi:hypothetical protein